MIDRHLAPTLASVAFLRVPGFSRRPVAEQLRLRAQLEAVVAVAIAPLPVADRLVLEAVDGVALVLLGDPRAAHETAERCVAAAAGLPLCIGLNHGPVALSGEGEAAGLVGDGLQAAAVVAACAEPGQLLVSRAFREALAETAPDREAVLEATGVFTDASVRSHELFAGDGAALRRRRRRLLAAGAAGALALVAAGVGLRLLRAPEPQPAAVLAFAIAPQGEVYIDGNYQGQSPPLQQVQLNAGLHRVEVRNGARPPLQLEVTLLPGERRELRHTFVVKKARPADAWTRLRRKLGIQ